MKYYDTSQNHLIFIKKQATPEFWDEHWDNDDFRTSIIAGKDDRFILDTTKKYLANGKVLEGGCGMGGKVYALHTHGYDAYGVDFATETVKEINAYVPEIKVFPADVMHLPFRSSIFDGYWSLGVIEHFYQGYGSIADEMVRVLKPGGFLFLTFPYISPLRQLKIKAGLYKPWDKSFGIESFYQFALDKNDVLEKFEKRGFELLEIKPIDGLKGFKDELSLLNPPLQFLYDYSGHSSIVKLIRKLLNKLFEPFASHVILLILKKKSDKHE